MQERRFQGRGDQRFEITQTDLGMRIFGRDDLALLGQTDLPVHGAGWLREDGLVAWATATPDSAAATVKQTQADAVLRFERAE